MSKPASTPPIDTLAAALEDHENASASIDAPADGDAVVTVHVGRVASTFRGADVDAAIGEALEALAK
jgi:hypothetical protein